MDDKMNTTIGRFGEPEKEQSHEQSGLKGIVLQPDETVMSDKKVAPVSAPVSLSAIESMLILTNVSRYRDIGSKGPSNASGSSEDSKAGNETYQGLYDVFFPRDGFVSAEILFDNHQELTRATVLAALSVMGVTDNYKNPVWPYDEQEIGKIPHELRNPDDPIAMELTRTKDWGWPYYGAVDTTGKNVLAVSRYVEHSAEGKAFLDVIFEGRDGINRTVNQGLDMNIDWLISRMELNPEGLVESLAKNPKHHPNQTWADSPEAFHRSDSSWARHYPEKNLGVAALELQADTYAALRGAAWLYRQLGEIEKADDLNQRADNLRLVVLDKFWVKDEAHFGGYFGRGTDRDQGGNLSVLDIRTSDMGNFLNSGILDDTDDEALNQEIGFKREAVINNLLSEKMLGLNGVRTLSTDSERYSDHRYHNGTTWPWVTYITAQGLRRYGRNSEAEDLENRIMAACEATGLLPEYFSGSNEGHSRLVDNRVVVENLTLKAENIYAVCQPAQQVQAWTVAAVLAIKERRGREWTKQNGIPV